MAEQQVQKVEAEYETPTLERIREGMQKAIAAGELTNEARVAMRLGFKKNRVEFEAAGITVEIRGITGHYGYPEHRQRTQRAKLHVTGFIQKHLDAAGLVEPGVDGTDAEWKAYRRRKNEVEKMFLAHFAAAIGLTIFDLKVRYSSRDDAWISETLRGVEVFVRIKPNAAEAEIESYRKTLYEEASALRRRKANLRRVAGLVGSLMDELDELDERDYEALEGAANGLEELLVRVEGHEQGFVGKLEGVHGRLAALNKAGAS